jgi:hypothetical protein
LKASSPAAMPRAAAYSTRPPVRSKKMAILARLHQPRPALVRQLDIAGERWSALPSWQTGFLLPIDAKS